MQQVGTKQWTTGTAGWGQKPSDGEVDWTQGPPVSSAALPAAPGGKVLWSSSGEAKNASEAGSGAKSESVTATSSSKTSDTTNTDKTPSSSAMANLSASISWGANASTSGGLDSTLWGGMSTTASSTNSTWGSSTTPSSLSLNAGHNMQIGASSVGDNQNSNGSASAGGWGMSPLNQNSASLPQSQPSSMPSNSLGQQQQQQSISSPMTSSQAGGPFGTNSMPWQNSKPFGMRDFTQTSDSNWNSTPTSVMSSISSTGTKEGASAPAAAGAINDPSKIDIAAGLANLGIDKTAPPPDVNWNAMKTGWNSGMDTSKAPEGAIGNPADISFAQATQKGLKPMLPVGVLTPKEEEIRRAIDTHEGWGTQPVRQDTSWDIESSPKASRKVSNDNPEMAASNVWNNNNGTAIWETTREPQAPGWQGGAAAGGNVFDKDPNNWNMPPKPNMDGSNWGGGGGNHPMGNNPMGNNPMGGPMGNNPMGGNPMGGNPMGGNPMGGNPMGGNPMGGNPMGGNPMGGNHMGGNPMGNNPMGNNSMSDKSIGTWGGESQSSSSKLWGTKTETGSWNEPPQARQNMTWAGQDTDVGTWEDPASAASRRIVSSSGAGPMGGGGNSMNMGNNSMNAGGGGGSHMGGVGGGNMGGNMGGMGGGNMGGMGGGNMGGGNMGGMGGGNMGGMGGGNMGGMSGGNMGGMSGGNMGGPNNMGGMGGANMGMGGGNMGMGGGNMGMAGGNMGMAGGNMGMPGGMGMGGGNMGMGGGNMGMGGGNMGMGGGNMGNQGMNMPMGGSNMGGGNNMGMGGPNNMNMPNMGAGDNSMYWNDPNAKPQGYNPATGPPRPKPDEPWNKAPMGRQGGGNGWGDPSGNGSQKADDGTSIWAANAQEQPQVNPASAMKAAEMNSGMGLVGARAGGWGEPGAVWNPQYGARPKSSWTPQNEQDNWQRKMQGMQRFPGGGGGGQPQMRSKLLQQLMDMGFKKEDAQNSLISNNMNFDNALSELNAGMHKTKDLDTDVFAANGAKMPRPGYMPDGGPGMMPDDISDNRSDNNNPHVPNFPIQNTPFNNAQVPNQPYMYQYDRSKGGPPTAPPANESINRNLQHKLKVLQQQGGPAPALNSLSPTQGVARGAAPPGSDTRTMVQQQAAQQQILQQLRLAVQSGLISPQLLNQQLPHNILVMLQQLLQLQNALQNLMQRQQFLQQNKVSLNIPRPQLEQVSVMITQYKSQILGLQKQLQAAQQSMLMKQQPPSAPTPTPTQMQMSQQPPMGMPPPMTNPMQGDGGENVLGMPGDVGGMGGGGGPNNAAMSRLNQWKQPTPERDGHGDLNKAPGSKLSQPGLMHSNSTPVMGPFGDLTGLNISGDTTWSSSANSGASNWPSAQGDGSGERKGDGTPPSSGIASMLGGGGNLGLSTDVIPEFVPGKPWQGLSNKSVEDDPHITPGSISRSLSVNVVKDDYLNNLASNKPSPSFGTDPTWSMGGKMGGNPSAAETSMANAMSLGASNLQAQQTNNRTNGQWQQGAGGFNRQHSWGGRSPGSAFTQVSGSGWENRHANSWLKNLSSQDEEQ